MPARRQRGTLLDARRPRVRGRGGRGYSTAIAPNQNRTFWGVDSNARVFRDFVMRYLAANNRATSPKFLFGESYGAPRTAVLANMLEQAGVALNGLVLQSSALNYNVNCGITDSTSVGCGGYLPSYGATSTWFGRTRPDPGIAGIPSFMIPVRNLAAERYEPALQRWMTSGTIFDTGLPAILDLVTGLSVATWQSNFNMRPDFYRVNLMPGTSSADTTRASPS